MVVLVKVRTVCNSETKSRQCKLFFFLQEVFVHWLVKFVHLYISILANVSVSVYVCGQWLFDLGNDRGFDGSDLAAPRWSRLPSLFPWCSLLRQRREGLQVGGDVGLILWDTAWHRDKDKKIKNKSGWRKKTVFMYTIRVKWKERYQ